ncbi:MAG: hypothetical protein AMXMBFR79_00370 [Chitinophagaceae bacterium]
MTDKNLYIIAGYNRAGKTTASFTILLEIISCKDFVTSDTIRNELLQLGVQLKDEKDGTVTWSFV